MNGCIQPCCRPVLAIKQCWGCGSRRVSGDDLASLEGVQLRDGRLRYDPQQVRVVVIEDICSAGCPGLPEFSGTRPEGERAAEATEAGRS